MHSIVAKALLITIVALGAACGGDSGTGPEGDSGPMTARIDGDPFVAQFVSVQRSSGFVYVNGGGSGQRAIGFVFPDDGTGTYTIAPGTLVAAGVQIGAESYTAGQSTGAGTISVTTFTDSRLAGTFSLTVVGPATLAITDGAFDITY